MFVLDLLLPFVSMLQQLVIRSRPLDTSSICLQFTQIKCCHVKTQLTVADIDPMIAKLEQGYSDVKLDEETGRYYLLITNDHESQKVKTVNSKRKIPLHKTLVDMGCIKYVKSCNDRVFEELTNVEVVTGLMPQRMNSLNITPTNELDHIRSFHSIRHTFITKCMSEPNININLLQQIVGHEISSFGITSNYTHKVADIKNLLPIIMRLRLGKA